MNPKYHGIPGKLAKGLEPYVNIYRLPILFKDTELQRRQRKGDFQPGEGDFHNEHYRRLVDSLKETNLNFL